MQRVCVFNYTSAQCGCARPPLWTKVPNKALSLSLSLSGQMCVLKMCVCVSRSRLQYCSMLICHGSESESCVLLQ